MAVYDIKGNEITVGDGTTPTQTIMTDIFDKVIETDSIVNLLDKTKSTAGRMQVPPDVNSYVQGVEVSDFINVMANNSYVCQVCDNGGLLGVDKVFYYDSSKNYIRTEDVVVKRDETYHWIIYAPIENGYIRYQYATEYADNPNPMVFLGSELSTNFVEYTDGVIDCSKYKYTINNDFKNILQRDYLQNNLYGKTVYWFGDSNSDNWASSTQRQEFEKKFGCTIRSYGTYGATWGDATNGVDSTDRRCAIGQYNEFLTECDIDSSTYLFPDNSAFFFMMGTNTSENVGTFPSDGVGSITDESCTNDISAMYYILKRIRYYGRKNPIGVFIPWECTGTKKEALIAICEYFCIPYFDITTFVPPYTRTMGLIRPDGTTVQNDYFTDGGVHLSAYGWEKFRRIAENWMAYQV